MASRFGLTQPLRHMEDPDLVALLDKIPLGEAIPPALYRAVADVLVYIYLINRGYTPAETAARVMGNRAGHARTRVAKH